ncbi:rhodanese-like domain-containing protein [Thermogymnomonas acidicola]|uniref:rhodanese-like domain-containing protein n=1 Tax=Thermogymnomonas acidicola TaxID=399579 RepID=UPI0009462D43|nr:rhodanese-like domain-containing protein [Thermogymnomonas acidicola]
MELKEAWEKLQSGEVGLIDARETEQFLNEHIPGSLCAPYSPYSWGGRSISRYLRDYPKNVLVVAGKGLGEKVRKELEENGFQVLAVIEGVEEWKRSGLPVSGVQEVEPERIMENLDEWEVIDVREPYEWNYGVIPKALRIPMNDLPDALGRLDRNKKYAVVCQHGNRSLSAALFLADNGIRAVSIAGGAWSAG